MSDMQKLELREACYHGIEGAKTATVEKTETYKQAVEMANERILGGRKKYQDAAINASQELFGTYEEQEDGIDVTNCEL